MKYLIHIPDFEVSENHFQKFEDNEISALELIEIYFRSDQMYFYLNECDD